VRDRAAFDASARSCSRSPRRERAAERLGPARRALVDGHAEDLPPDARETDRRGPSALPRRGLPQTAWPPSQS